MRDNCVDCYCCCSGNGTETKELRFIQPSLVNYWHRIGLTYTRKSDINMSFKFLHATVQPGFYFWQCKIFLFIASEGGFHGRLPHNSPPPP
jgi:succinate dehydrogenase/fumarate reductase-like Fe-S protein